MLRAGRINPRTHFVVASVEEALPFASGSFDIVWFGETLARLFDGHNALSEFRRALKPGGHLIFPNPYHGRLKSLAIALSAFSKQFYSDDYRSAFTIGALSRFRSNGQVSHRVNGAGSGEAGHFGNRSSWLQPNQAFQSLRPPASSRA